MNNDKQLEQLGQKAFALHRKIADIEEKRRELFIANILHLAEMKKEKLYKAYLGDEDAPWTAYLAQTDVFMTRAKVNRWLYLHDNLIEPYQLTLITIIDVPESRLEDIARFAKSKEEAIKLIDTAKEALPGDWRDTINELRGKPTRETCKHSDTEKLEVCKDCGNKHKLDG